MRELFCTNRPVLSVTALLERAMRPCLPRRLRVNLLFIMLVLPSSHAYDGIYSGPECGTCIGNSKVVCRSSFSSNMAYCCDTTGRDTSQRACTQAPLCTTDLANTPGLQYLACPYETGPCGKAGPEIRLSMNQSVTITINNRFTTSDQCWYAITTDD